MSEAVDMAEGFDRNSDAYDRDKTSVVRVIAIASLVLIDY
jgi:hypothetical protein